MNSTEMWISVIGSFASIGSAIWAFFEAKKASKSAQKAKQVRDEIIERRKIVETSHVYTETKRLLGIISKIGPSSNPDLLKGVDINGIIKDVENYAQLINEHNIHYDEFSKNVAKELFTNINKNIELLSLARTEAKYKEIGTSIYHGISVFLPIAKSLADNIKERVVT